MQNASDNFWSVLYEMNKATESPMKKSSYSPFTQESGHFSAKSDAGRGSINATDMDACSPTSVHITSTEGGESGAFDVDIPRETFPA